jgi:hypothetical protein
METRVLGGTGGVINEGTFWVRVDDSGNAKIQDIREALKKATLNITLEKP